MPPRRKRKAPKLDHLVDDVIDAAVGSVFDRAGRAVERFRDSQRESFDEEYLRQSFRCVACKKTLVVEEMEMLHPDNGWGTCKGCFSFMWSAAEEKLKLFAQRAASSQRRPAQAASGRATPSPGPIPPPGEPPWQVLGVAQNASVDDVKKAYRKLAMLWHPDRLDANATHEQKTHGRAMFEKINRAYTVMMKVRQPPEA
jgi:hypothetical protein